MKLFKLFPNGKDYLWGGTRLRDEYGKNLPLTPFAESWECSTHPAGPSYVTTGSHKGMSLPEFLKAYPEARGTRVHSPEGMLPILVKFIDANADLSVQVHPDDEYAHANENGELGKNEMWYVVDSTPDGALVLGMKQTVSKEEVMKNIEAGTLENLFNKVNVKAGDATYVEAGTIHAIGHGNLLVEIQETSDLTYRLYDYNRRDKNGNLRPLHIAKALDVANLNKSTDPLLKTSVITENADLRLTEVCHSRFFNVDRCDLLTDVQQTMQQMPESFQVYICIEGEGMMDDVPFSKGDSIFIPAGNSEFVVKGKSAFIVTYC